MKYSEVILWHFKHYIFLCIDRPSLHDNETNPMCSTHQKICHGESYSRLKLKDNKKNATMPINIKYFLFQHFSVYSS